MCLTMLLYGRATFKNHSNHTKTINTLENTNSKLLEQQKTKWIQYGFSRRDRKCKANMLDTIKKLKLPVPMGVKKKQ